MNLESHVFVVMLRTFLVGSLLPKPTFTFLNSMLTWFLPTSFDHLANNLHPQDVPLLRPFSRAERSDLPRPTGQEHNHTMHNLLADASEKRTLQKSHARQPPVLKPVSREARRRTCIVYSDRFFELPTKVQPADLPQVHLSAQRLEFRFWLECDRKHHGGFSVPCTVLSELKFHLTWVRQIVARAPNPRVFILLGLCNTKACECEALFHAWSRVLVNIRGFCDLVVRKVAVHKAEPESVPWGPEGAEKPRVIFKYDERTKRLDRVNSLEGTMVKTLESFDFSEDDEVRLVKLSSLENGVGGVSEDKDEG